VQQLPTLLAAFEVEAKAQAISALSQSLAPTKPVSAGPEAEKPAPLLKCPVPGCAHEGFLSRSGLNRHRRNKHGGVPEQSLDEVAISQDVPAVAPNGEPASNPQEPLLHSDSPRSETAPAAKEPDGSDNVPNDLAVTWPSSANPTPPAAIDDQPASTTAASNASSSPYDEQYASEEPPSATRAKARKSTNEDTARGVKRPASDRIHADFAVAPRRSKRRQQEPPLLEADHQGQGLVRQGGGRATWHRPDNEQPQDSHSAPTLPREVETHEAAEALLRLSGRRVVQ
jgi:hypothetical protein